MNTTPQTLVDQWLAEAESLQQSAALHRKNGMYELARGERLKADQLVDCATALQLTLPAESAPLGFDLQMALLQEVVTEITQNPQGHDLAGFSASIQEDPRPATDFECHPAVAEWRAHSEQRNAEQAIRAMRELLKLIPLSVKAADPTLPRLQGELMRTTPASLPKNARAWAALMAKLLSAAVTQLHALQPRHAQPPAGASTLSHPAHPQTESGEADPKAEPQAPASAVHTSAASQSSQDSDA